MRVVTREQIVLVETAIAQAARKMEFPYDSGCRCKNCMAIRTHNLRILSQEALADCGKALIAGLEKDDSLMLVCGGKESVPKKAYFMELAQRFADYLKELNQWRKKD